MHVRNDARDMLSTQERQTATRHGPRAIEHAEKSMKHLGQTKDAYRIMSCHDMSHHVTSCHLM